MELLIYLSKVNIALLVFYIIYYLLLQHDTFYQWNRFYFLGIIVICLGFPFVNTGEIFNQPDAVHINLEELIVNRTQNFSSIHQEQSHIWEYIQAIYWFGFFCMALNLVIQFYQLLKFRFHS